MISKNPFQLYSSILGLSAPADSDVGGGKAPEREANVVMRINHIYLEQPCVLIGLWSGGLSHIVQIID